MSNRRYSSVLIAVLFAVTILPTLTVAQVKVKSFAATGPPAFVTGHFGGAVNAVSDAALRASAKSALQGIVIEHFGAAGNEETIERPIGLIPLSSQARLCVGTTRIGNLDL
jgi:hypothetical protein